MIDALQFAYVEIVILLQFLYKTVLSVYLYIYIAGFQLYRMKYLWITPGAQNSVSSFRIHGDHTRHGALLGRYIHLSTSSIISHSREVTSPAFSRVLSAWPGAIKYLPLGQSPDLRNAKLARVCQSSRIPYSAKDQSSSSCRRLCRNRPAYIPCCGKWQRSIFRTETGHTSAFPESEQATYNIHSCTFAAYGARGSLWISSSLDRCQTRAVKLSDARVNMYTFVALSPDKQECYRR